MKQTYKEIIEGYQYDSYEEYEAHYNQMQREGYTPSQSTGWYTNKALDSYYGQYSKMQIE